MGFFFLGQIGPSRRKPFLFFLKKGESFFPKKGGIWGGGFVKGGFFSFVVAVFLFYFFFAIWQKCKRACPLFSKLWAFPLEGLGF